MIDTTGCTISLYSQDTCNGSTIIRNWLDHEQIPHAEQNVSKDLTAALELAATGIFATPLVTVCDHVVFGENPASLEQTILSCERRRPIARA